MLPYSIGASLELATRIVSPLLLFCLCAWSWRLSRKLQQLEKAASRVELDRAAVPQPIDDSELPETALPRFIGNPYQGRNRIFEQDSLKR